MKRTGIVLLVSLMGFLACQSEKNPAPILEKTQEAHRPNYHFTPPSQWMNDPNGIVYFAGEWHLFYQHYPDSTVWGPMHWGHAVSTDLVHWEHLPIGLYPDSLGYIFSGSAVVDQQNTSGFGQNGEPPLVAMFTYHDPVGEKAGKIDFQYQGIAYSTDKGRTWTKYEGNPVIPNPGIRDFRDTKVRWHEESQQWICVLAAWDQVKFYGSADLKNWTHLSDFGQEWGSHAGVWECPDLFPLQTADGKEYWVLLLSINPGGPNGGSGTQYFIGQFDGQYFELNSQFALALQNAPADSSTQENAIWLDYGRDNYAGVTWDNAPDKRRIFMGWMSNWDYAQVVPTESWRSAMTLPRRLNLVQTPKGLRLQSQAVAELKDLRKATHQLEAGSLNEVLEIPFDPSGTEILLETSLPFGMLTLLLTNSRGETFEIGYDAERKAFFSDRTKAGKTDFSTAFATDKHWAPRISQSDTIKMHLFFDVASVELFADDGLTCITDIFFPNEDFQSATLRYQGAGGELKKGMVWFLE